MFTLREVARLANVSIATASAVMNGKAGVSPKLTKRVKEAMEALDYHPDQVARSLKVRRTSTLGMVVPDVTNPFFTDVMCGVEDKARRCGYSVILCNVNEDPELERHHLGTLFSRRVDGVLLSPTDPHAVLDRQTRRRFPMVFFDRIPSGYTGPAVVTDNFGASSEAGRHLIGLGHKRIAVIAGRSDLSNAQARLEGIRRAMQEACLPLADEYLRNGDFRLESGYRCGLELMRLPNPPTAIFCCNNKMTIGLMRALGELRIPCPQRVSVLGFDDFDWAANFTPRLSTIAQPTYDMGWRATELLLRMLHADKNGSNEPVSKVIVLPNELRIRDSTGPPFSP